MLQAGAQSPRPGPESVCFFVFISQTYQQKKENTLQIYQYLLEKDKFSISVLEHAEGTQ